MNEREHLLIIADEESHEIGQRATKALRFGLDEIQPVDTGGDGITPNRERISREVNDLLGVLEMLDIAYGDRNQIDAKKSKVRHFLEYSRQQGTLE